MKRATRASEDGAQTGTAVQKVLQMLEEMKVKGAAAMAEEEPVSKQRSFPQGEFLVIQAPQNDCPDDPLLGCTKTSTLNF